MDSFHSISSSVTGNGHWYGLNLSLPLLGNGAYSWVYKLTDKTVLKVNRTSTLPYIDGWLPFAWFATQNPDVNLPRIYQLKTFSFGGYMAEVERLKPQETLSYPWLERLSIYKRMFDALGAPDDTTQRNVMWRGSDMVINDVYASTNRTPWVEKFITSVMPTLDWKATDNRQLELAL